MRFLPEKISELDQLIELHFEYSPIRYLPTGLKNLDHLKTIVLREHKIELHSVSRELIPTLNRINCYINEGFFDGPGFITSDSFKKELEKAQSLEKQKSYLSLDAVAHYAREVYESEASVINSPSNPKDLQEHGKLQLNIKNLSELDKQGLAYCESKQFDKAGAVFEKTCNPELLYYLSSKLMELDLPKDLMKLNLQKARSYLTSSCIITFRKVEKYIELLDQCSKRLEPLEKMEAVSYGKSSHIMLPSPKKARISQKNQDDMNQGVSNQSKPC